jgi:putative ABC transport system ATP-binding protein
MLDLSDKLVVIKGLNHTYPEGDGIRRVLYDINLTIQAGCIVFITGESGSGKTTLLSLIGCLRSLQEGSIKIFGQELSGANQRQLLSLRQNIGYVFQHFNLLEFLTARENVQTSLEIQPNFSPIQVREKSEWMLEQVGLGNKINAYPSELSGGQKQRVAIARALVHKPKLLLADEPTAALDSTTGREIIELITRLAKQQESAAIIVTHNRRLLPAADQVIHVENGKLTAAIADELSLSLPTLTDYQLDQITPFINVVNYDALQTIVAEDEPANEFFIILDGSVEVIKFDLDQTPQIIAQLNQHDYFGEVGLLTGGRRTATVRVSAKGQAKILVLDRTTFANLIGNSETTKSFLINQAHQRLKTTMPTNKNVNSQEIIDLLYSISGRLTL